MLPADIQKLFAFFPAHHGATMMREIMTKEALSATFGSVADQTIKGRLMTAQEIKQTYAAENGIIYIFENTRFTFPVMLTIVIGARMVFFLISCMFMMKYRKK